MKKSSRLLKVIKKSYQWTTKKITYKGEKYYIIDDDTHLVCLGATRSGKSRTLVLQSVGVLALAGESIIATDPKGELYLYTHPFLERLGYEVVVIDFNEPNKSTRYNFLQPVIDAVNQDDIPKALSLTRDIVSALVVDVANTEPIWKDGQRSILNGGIISIVYDNKDRPEYQNLTNAFYFLAKMCKPDKNGVLPLSEYIKNVDSHHPARQCVEISEIAPSNMRGSFYTSAMATLELFTDSNIYDMTRATDFDIYTTGENKRAIFIILPDEKSTYYPVASLFIYQHYQTLVEVSKRNGNRLNRRVNFVEDEKGNFTKMNDYSKLITVGGGRGIRFNMFLQAFEQLDDVYGDNQGSIIRSNCETWVYLQSDNIKTLEELSGKLGKYTVASPSASSSTGGNVSCSFSYTGRELLYPDEIKRLKRPYQLVMTRNAPTIMYAPDISKTMFNKMYGLGGKMHNKNLIKERGLRRVARDFDISSMALFTIDNYFKNLKENNRKTEIVKSEKIQTRIKDQSARITFNDNIEEI